MGTRKGYDLELKEINDRVETMGKQVLLAIDRTIIALEKMDVVAANAIMKNDALIDAMVSHTAVFKKKADGLELLIGHYETLAKAGGFV